MGSLQALSARYTKLHKPGWAPIAFYFTKIWAGVYVLIFISFGYTAYLYMIGRVPFIFCLPFILNLIFNFSFLPLQVPLRNLKLAAVDSLFILITLVWGMVMFWAYAPWVSIINIPYLIWLIICMRMQFSILRLNKSK